MTEKKLILIEIHASLLTNVSFLKKEDIVVIGTWCFILGNIYKTN